MHRALGAAVIAIVAAAAWAGRPAPARAAAGRMPGKNVLIVLLDTVRADRLGRPQITPRLDQFARTAVRFDRAFSHAPWTLPSVASLLTSRHPMGHGAGGPPGAFTGLAEDVVTLPELFARAGARTGAVANVMFLGPDFGLARGYGHLDYVPSAGTEGERRAGPTTDAALAFLDAPDPSGAPFFLLVHYFDAHLDYDPPPAFRDRLADPADRGNRDRPFTHARLRAFRRRGIAVDPSLVRRLEKLYDAEVAYLDHEVGRLLDGLARRGLDDRTVVVVTADHGEEFLDHGGFEHQHTLYDEQLHVPLLVRAPGVGRPGSSVASSVRLIDLAPTLCALAGVPPDEGFAGLSLVGLLQGRPEPDRSVLAQGALRSPHREALRVGHLKLIRTSSPPGAELYDTARDPDERQDLAQQWPEKRESMLRQLFLLLEAGTVRRPPGEGPALTEEQKERLRALGYVD